MGEVEIGWGLDKISKKKGVGKEYRGVFVKFGYWGPYVNYGKLRSFYQRKSLFIKEKFRKA